MSRKMEFKETLKELLIKREQQLEDFFNQQELEKGEGENDEFRSTNDSEENRMNDFDQMLDENRDKALEDGSESEFSHASGDGSGKRDWELGASEDGTSEISTPVVREHVSELSDESAVKRSDETSSESQDKDEDNAKTDDPDNPETPEGGGLAQDQGEALRHKKYF